MEIQVARDVDVERVVSALREQGYDPEVDGLDVRVRCDDQDAACDGLVSDLEAWLAESAIPLVPERANGHVYLRPPSG